MFDILLNPNRLEKVVSAAAGPQAGGQVANILGAEDKLGSAFFVDATGGAELKVRIGLDLKILPRALYMALKGFAAGMGGPGQK